jgi:hypothetical protein
MSTNQVVAVMKVHDAIVQGKNPVVEAGGKARELPQEFSFTLRDLIEPGEPQFANQKKLDEGSMGRGEKERRNSFRSALITISFVQFMLLHQLLVETLLRSKRSN